MTGLESLLLNYALNALWQIPLITLAALAAARVARQAGAQAQHLVWVGALLLQVLLPACTFRLVPVPGFFAPRQALQSAGSVTFFTSAAIGREAPLLHLPHWLGLLIVLSYLAFGLYAAARLAYGMVQTGALQRQATPLSLAQDQAALWATLSRGLATSGLSESAAITGPVTVGILSPAVLLPPRFLSSLHPQQLHALLAHEAAHIRRHDCALNLLYSVLTLPIAFHPLLRLTWVRLAESREMVCDQQAATLLAAPEIYRRSLLQLAQLLSGRAQATHLHAIGLFDAHTFERRLMNLTGRKENMTVVRRTLLTSACLAIALVTCASASALRLHAAAGSPQEHVAGGIMAANVVSRRTPVYPAEAKANHDTVNGSVILHVVINDQGVPQTVEVQKSLREDYDQSALEAVKDWRWKPMEVNGVPTSVDTIVTITYSIEP